MKKIIKPLLVLSAFFIHQTFATTHDIVDQLANHFMEKNHIDGMSIAVINKNKVQTFNYGFANKAEKIKTTDGTIYTIASFSKTMTATLAAIAAADGKLDLDAPFTDYFPNLNNENLNKVSTRHLLSHTSSFPFDFQPRPKTFSEIKEHLNQFKQPIKPGTEYGYSNAGIGTAGYVLQYVYHKNYEQILENNLLKPLKMKSTYLNVPVDQEKRIAVGHDKNDAIVPYDRELTAWFPAASIKSTIKDMALYLKAHMNDETLPDETLSRAMKLAHENKFCFDDKISCEQLAWQARLMTEINHSTGDSYFLHYDETGFPVFEKKKIISNNEFENNKFFIEKTGSAYGMSGYMIYLPHEKFGVVLLINKEIGDERIRLGRDIIIQANNKNA